MGITPSNSPGTKGTYFLLWKRDFLVLPYMVIGIPHWSWNTIPWQGEYYIHQISELF